MRDELQRGRMRAGLATRGAAHAFALVLTLLVGHVAVAGHPFRASTVDLAAARTTIVAPTTAGARATRLRAGIARRLSGSSGDPVRGLLGQLSRDPMLQRIGVEMDLEGWLRRAGRGEIDLAAYRKSARGAVARVIAGDREGVIQRRLEVGTPGEARALLVSKLDALEALFTVSPPSPTARVAGDVPGPDELATILGPRTTEVVRLAPAPGATVVFPRDAGVDVRARYGVTLESGRRGQPAIAQIEVGRAVLTDAHEVVKGVGPTRFAGNRFGAARSGTFSLREANADVAHSKLLRRAGVAVYEPRAVVRLPYLEWHDAKGWMPIATYARGAEETLRVSDLDHVQPGVAVERLRTRLRRTTGLGSDDAVARLVATRLGRAAGRFESAFGGRTFFHGMLHAQNVSLLGEIVDVGKGRFLAPAQVSSAWAASAYGDMPEAAGARSEADVLRRHALRVAKVIAPRVPPAEIGAAFDAARR